MVFKFDFTFFTHTCICICVDIYVKFNYIIRNEIHTYNELPKSVLCL